MSLQLIDSGTIAPANLSGGYVAVATLAAPDPVADGSGSSFAYTLVVRMTGLGAAHALRLRETQGAAVETEDVTGKLAVAGVRPTDAATVAQAFGSMNQLLDGPPGAGPGESFRAAIQRLARAAR
jgi:hypothetical protein